ncbi:MAG: hypothetical protein U1E70_10930 [Acetobacteraceae bacterium]|nr:hypothetical protein [Pseudomonadota bacterium]
MRAVRALAGGFAGSAGQPWLPGLPHAVAGLATWFAFGGAACITGLLLATVASFVVFLPLTALALNGGQALAEDAPAPILPLSAQAGLFVLWTLTAWATAALTYAAG